MDGGVHQKSAYITAPDQSTCSAPPRGRHRTEVIPGHRRTMEIRKSNQERAGLRMRQRLCFAHNGIPTSWQPER